MTFEENIYKKQKNDNFIKTIMLKMGKNITNQNFISLIFIIIGFAIFSLYYSYNLLKELNQLQYFFFIFLIIGFIAFILIEFVISFFYKIYLLMDIRENIKYIIEKEYNSN